MKRTIHITIVLCALLLLLLALPLGTGAKETAPPTSSEEVFSFVGFSARLGDQGGIRAVFSVKEAELARLEGLGYTLEVGALLSVSGDAFPRYEEDAPGVVFRWEDGLWEESFLLSSQKGEKQVAFAVDYRDPTPEMCAQELRFTIYLRLFSKNGEETILYLDAQGSKAQGSFSSVYDALSQMPEYQDNAFVRRMLRACYRRVTLLLDAEQGEDGNDGLTQPIRTLEKAFSLLPGLLDSDTPVHVTVSLAPGTYRIQKTLSLSKDQIRAKKYALTLRGSQEGESIITTGVTLSPEEFEPVDGERYYVYYFSPDDNDQYPHFRAFYVNGETQTLARHGYARTQEAEENGGIEEMWRIPYEFNGVQPGTAPQPVAGKYKLYLPIWAVDTITPEDLARKTVELHTPIGWYFRMMHIDGVDFSDWKDNNVAVYIRPSEAKQAETRHGFYQQYFWLENALSFLDEPGEYFYDEEDGALYYYPPYEVDLYEASLEYATGGHMLSFKGVADLTLENLVITGNDNADFGKDIYLGTQAATAPGALGKNTLSAVLLENTTGVTVEECIFRDLATTAVHFYGATRNATVDTCRFLRIGSSAIIFGKHNGNWNQYSNKNENIEIYNNLLEDIATLTRGSVGILVNVADGLEIHGNTIKGTSYTAISVGWRWAAADWQYGKKIQLQNVSIHHNYISGFMTDQQDGGAIYTLGGNVEASYHAHFNAVHHNVIYYDAASWDGKGIAMPLYHDGSSSNWHTYGNVILMDPGREVYVTIYLQNIISERVHNVLVEDNHILAPLNPLENHYTGKTPKGLELEYLLFGKDGNCPRPDAPEVGYSHYSRVSRERFNEQRNNTLYDLPEEMLAMPALLAQINNAGSTLAPTDAEGILEELIAPYEDFWGRY